MTASVYVAPHCNSVIAEKMWDQKKKRHAAITVKSKNCENTNVFRNLMANAIVLL